VLISLSETKVSFKLSSTFVNLHELTLFA
jgi:hypothetical protein